MGYFWTLLALSVIFVVYQAGIARGRELQEELAQRLQQLDDDPGSETRRQLVFESLPLLERLRWKLAARNGP